MVKLTAAPAPNFIDDLFEDSNEDSHPLGKPLCASNAVYYPPSNNYYSNEEDDSSSED